MDFIIAAEAAKDTMTGLEKAGLGGRTLLIGLLMVFTVLGILIGLVTLNKVIFGKMEERKKAKQAKKTVTAPKAELPLATAPAVSSAVASNEEEEVVAAITAAISLYYEQQMASTGKTVKFRVRSIKEIR